jgi:hypothetical protein
MNPYEKSWMMFVDGENLTIRGQQVASEVQLPLKPGRYWQKDTFIWWDLGKRPAPARALFFAVEGVTLQSLAIRSYFYTSLAGDYPKLETVKDSLWQLGFTPRCL